MSDSTCDCSEDGEDDDVAVDNVVDDDGDDDDDGCIFLAVALVMADSPDPSSSSIECFEGDAEDKALLNSSISSGSTALRLYLLKEFRSSLSSFCSLYPE